MLLLSARDIEDTLKPRKGRDGLLAADELEICIRDTSRGNDVGLVLGIGRRASPQSLNLRGNKEEKEHKTNRRSVFPFVCTVPACGRQIDFFLS